jgi:hypothetical protein
VQQDALPALRNQLGRMQKMRGPARAPIGVGGPVEIDAAHVPRRNFRARGFHQPRHFVRVFAAIAQQHEEGSNLLR